MIPVKIPGLTPPTRSTVIPKPVSIPVSVPVPVIAAQPVAVPVIAAQPVAVPVPDIATQPVIQPVSAPPVAPPVCIMIGTPAYGGLCYVSYVQSLLSSMQFLSQHNIQIEPCFLSNESLIPRGRNTIVAKFLNNKKFTHLLFIDADLNWAAQSILRLVNHNKGIIGGLYPKKGYEWQKLIKNNEVLETLKAAETEKRDLTETEISHIRAKLMSFVVNFDKEKLQVKDGVLSVKHIGTGFMMIKREVLEKMSDAFPELKYDDDINVLQGTENDHLYAFFNCEIHKLSGKQHYLSEDFMFCKRWSDLGNEIFADITIPLTHTGTHSFAGNFAIAHNLKFSTQGQTNPVPVTPQTNPVPVTTNPVLVVAPQLNPVPSMPQTIPVPAVALPHLEITKIPQPQPISNLRDAISVAPMSAPRIKPNQVGNISII